MLRAVVISVFGIVGLVSVACGSKDEPAPTSRPPTTTAPGTTRPDPCKPTSIEVTADGGPATVDGTTNYSDITGTTPSQSGTFTLANYDIAERDARGVLQPTGLSAGQAVVMFTMTGAEFGPGTYVDQTAQAGEKKINFFAIYTSAGRALPTADHEVTLTEVGTERVCGSIKPAAGSTGASATGSFTTRRIDSGPTTHMTSGSGTTATTGSRGTSTTR